MIFIIEGIKYICKKIENHPHYYVSRCGKVISHTPKRTRLIKGSDHKGYIRIDLRKGRRKGLPKVGGSARLHRLVFDAFGSRLDINLEINHINGDKKDNRIENLEQISHVENIKHAHNMGRYKNRKRRKST